ncbi:hypothetical protein DL93DRAFT_1126370 [Clavulina sp. PMI_390]|nr:hypothetical protein DL93DRAFT_1126370 [Clavulina sp. PMI_390]
MLLVLLNKYQAAVYEEFVWRLIEPKGSTDGLKAHTSSEFNAVEVIRLARKANRQGLAHSAAQVLVEQLWAKDPDLSPFDALLFSDEFGDLALRGAAYYQVMLLGRAGWKESRLSECHRQNLMAGMLRSGDEWQSFTRALGDFEKISHPLIHQECLRRAQRDDRMGYLPGRLWRDVEQSDVLWFDFFGKFDLVVNQVYRSGPRHQPGICSRSGDCPPQYAKEIGVMKLNLHTWFESPEQ